MGLTRGINLSLSSHLLVAVLLRSLQQVVVALPGGSGPRESLVVWSSFSDGWASEKWRFRQMTENTTQNVVLTVGDS